MNKPKAIYFHIPFCEYICSYCDFTKLQYFRFLAEKYLISLEKELNSYNINQNEIETIFVGGGTPTSLEDDLFERLLKIISPFSKNAIEYTFEANPESLTKKKIALLKKYGVNRVSLGVESTNDTILKKINRHHTFLDVKSCIDELINKGINNINVDLILGLPNVTKSMFLKDLDNILSLPITHISIYSLSVHPHTSFYLNGVKERGSKIEREYYDLAHEKLLQNGFIHYEISNFAKEGYFSKHNLTYWKNERYYGIGLSAASYIGNGRFTNTKNLNKYNDGFFEKEEEIVTPKDQITYQIMLNLRTIFGLDTTILSSLYAYDILINKDKEVGSLISRGLIKLNNKIITPTYEGMMLLDQIILELLP